MPSRFRSTCKIEVLWSSCAASSAHLGAEDFPCDADLAALAQALGRLAAQIDSQALRRASPGLDVQRAGRDAPPVAPSPRTRYNDD